VLVVCGLGGACGDGGPPAGSEKVLAPSAVGDCLRPDPDRAGGFLQARCGADEATVEIVDVASRRGAGPHCPDGTDVLADATAGRVSGGRIDGAVSLWCLRNLAAPHPGDPGMGGGELTVGDCFTLGTAPPDDGGPSPDAAPDGDGGAVQEVPCGPTYPGAYRLAATTARTEDCPATGTEPIELAKPRLTVLCATPPPDEAGAPAPPSTTAPA
jgi:hypothetical protein